jgi:hypothetical protein
MGNDNHVVVSHKPFGFNGHVGGHVLKKEPVVVLPKFRSFSSHIFFQALQNITVKVRVDRNVMTCYDSRDKSWGHVNLLS